MESIINQAVWIIAVLATGVVYETDVFYALIVRKATRLSKESSIADLTGHTHFIADQRMPFFGVTGVVCTAIYLYLHFSYLPAGTLLMLLLHLALYLISAVPINKQLAEAAIHHRVPANTRTLQNRWNSIVTYRAVLLTGALLLLLLSWTH